MEFLTFVCSSAVSEVKSSERPATGHLTTGSLGFPLSASKCRDGSQAPRFYTMPLKEPLRFEFIKLNSCFKDSKLFFSKVKILDLTFVYPCIVVKL